MAGIIAYLRNMNYFDTAAVKTGDAARGRAIFDGKGGCTACHRVGVAGSRVAPNLSEIGSARSAGSLQRSRGGGVGGGGVWGVGGGGL